MESNNEQESKRWFKLHGKLRDPADCQKSEPAVPKELWDNVQEKILNKQKNACEKKTKETL